MLFPEAETLLPVSFGLLLCPSLGRCRPCFVNFHLLPGPPSWADGWAPRWPGSGHCGLCLRPSRRRQRGGREEAAREAWARLEAQVSVQSASQWGTGHTVLLQRRRLRFMLVRGPHKVIRSLPRSRVSTRTLTSARSG